MKPAHAMVWNDANLKRLLSLLNQKEPHLSYTEIGQQMGITRNAISGAVGRLKAAGVIEADAARKPCMPPRPPKKRFVFGSGPSSDTPTPPKPLPLPEPSLETAVSTLEVKDGMCRWVVNDGPDWMHCGAEASGTYCIFHAGIAFQPQLPRRAA